MRFTSSFLALGAELFSLATALPSPSPDRSVAMAPVAATNRSDSAPHQLVTFDILWWYLGLGLDPLEYDAFGEYNKCYNLPGLFAYITGSIKPIPPTPGCWVYPKPNCQGGYTVVLSAGQAIWEGTSGSFICDPPS